MRPVSLATFALAASTTLFILLAAHAVLTAAPQPERLDCFPQDGVIIVTRCGARGNGLISDSAAIARAIAAARPARSEIYFPPGRYLIDEPLTGFDGISLRGAMGAYSYSTSGVGSPGLPSALVAARSLGARAMVDFRHLSNTSIAYLGFELGSTRSSGIELGSHRDGIGYPNHEFDHVSVHGGLVGLRARNAPLLHIHDSNFSDARYIGIWLDAYCGDSDLNGNYVNGTFLNAALRQPIQSHDSTDPTGAGIFLGNGSGNTNIRGGKLEWNLKGIVVSDAQGVTITGVNFDFNTWGHVVVHGYHGAPQVYPRGILINGNRFLSGGLYGNQSAISVKADRAEAIVNITGNTFSMAANRANDYDGSAASPSAGDPSVGPRKFCILAESERGTVYLNVVGNEMLHCARDGTMRAFGDNVVVHESGNLVDIPRTPRMTPK